MNLIKRLGAAYRAFRFPSFGCEDGRNLNSYFPSSLGRSSGMESGAMWENSIVLAAIYWIVRTFPEAPLYIKKSSGRGGHYEILQDHPFLCLLDAPNPHYDGSVLWSGTLMSLNLDGNAYWYKARSAAGKVAELWYVPHYHIEPIWKSDGSSFISGYEYYVDGQKILIPVKDIVHFRAGIPHPLNTRKGLSPLAGVVREVCADNEASVFSAALLRNMGVPGVIISPSKESMDLSAEQHEKLLALWSAKFCGDRRGEPLVVPSPIEIRSPGFNPEQMVLDKVRRIPEERITAALGISAIVIGLGAGLERSTYSNYREAREAAYESNIIPTQRMLLRQLTRQLFDEFVDVDQEKLFFDLSEVHVLREDQDRLHSRIVGDYQGGVITRSEARSALGWPVGAGDGIYVYEC